MLRIIDLWGMGLGHIRFARDFLAVAVRQTVILYPETLDRVLVVNAATWWQARRCKEWLYLMYTHVMLYGCIEYNPQHPCLWREVMPKAYCESKPIREPQQKPKFCRSSNSYRVVPHIAGKFLQNAKASDVVTSKFAFQVAP